jgi:hypothetical protein
MDIGLDENFDLALDHRNDFPVVEGRAAFEQELRVRLYAHFSKVLAEASPDDASTLLQVEARRIARDMGELDRIASLIIEPASDLPNTLDVTIFYATGTETTFSLSE